MSDEPIESNDNIVARDNDLAPQTSCADGEGVARPQRIRAGGGRFSKGQSGNPRGRPRKQAEPFLAMMKRVLNETVQLNRDGRRVEMSCGEAGVSLDVPQGNGRPAHWQRNFQAGRGP